MKTYYSNYKNRFKKNNNYITKTRPPKLGFVKVGNTNIKHGISKLEIDILKNFPNAEHSKLIRGFGGKIYIVDGYISKNNEIIEILGDFFHGNLTKYKPTDINPLCKKTMLQLYNETIVRFNMFHSLHFKVRFIWESDWKRFKSLGRYYRGPGDNLF